MTKLIMLCTLFGFLAGQTYAQQQLQNQEKIDYFGKVEKYRRMKNSGIALTVVGSVLLAAGTITVLNATVEEMFYVESKSADIGVACMLAGQIGLGAGIPLWIVGANNQRKYSMKVQELTVKINATPQSHGLTLTYRF